MSQPGEDSPELSAPYLQLLDIEAALQRGMPLELAQDYLNQLEEYLWTQIDSLGDESHEAAALLREGLLRLAQAAQSLADGSCDDAPARQRWLEVAHRANQLLMQGVRTSQGRGQSI